MIFAHLIQSASNLPTDVSALESSISALESAISVLESDIKTLESSSVPWEHSVWVFTFLVAVGVAMEMWVIRHEYRDDMEGWALAHFGVLRSPGRPSITKLSVEVGSVLLITIGIMGELGIGIKIAAINGVLRGKSAELRSKNGELRSKSDQLLALVTQQAGDAANSAKTAHNEADAAEASAGRAMRKAREAEEYAAPRSISDKQAALIRKRIQPLTGHKIIFFGNFHDTGISDFANRLGAILGGGIMDVSSGVWNAGMVTPSGMKFGYGKDRKADFELLVIALDEAGVEKADVLRKKATMKGYGDDWLTITFGAKH